MSSDDTNDSVSSRRKSLAELRAQRIDELLDTGRDQVLQQIIGPFGLTPAMFADKTGGNVTSQHNADKGIFAKRSEGFDRKHYNYERAKKEKIREAVRNGLLNPREFTDTYTDQKEPTRRLDRKGKQVINVELDHTIPLKEAHRKGGWMRDVAGRTEISSEKDNLNLTTYKNNRAKNAKPAADALSAKNGYDESITSPVIDKATSSIDPLLPTTKQRAVYHGKELLFSGAEEAGRNALRHATGMLLFELVNGSYVEIKHIAQARDLRANFVDRLIDALHNVAKRVEAKLGNVFNTVISGGVQGFIGNFLTFVINNIVTTSAKVVTAIREGFKSLWEAVKLLVSPPTGMSGIEVARQVTKLIGGVVSTSLGLLFEKSIEVFVSSIPLLAPLAGVIAPALTAIITGIVAALVVFGIDRFFDWLGTSGTEMLSAQIGNMETSLELFDRTAQMLQRQFDNSAQYQLCIKQYVEIEAQMMRSEVSINGAVDEAGKAIQSRAVTLGALEKGLPQIRKMDDEIEALLFQYDAGKRVE